MEENRNKRIAKNTLFMYFRMLFLMFVSLFTVRIVLKNLGVEDYGIYNLIAGVVVLFNFIANSSSAATSRYLNFALGENDYEKANRVYSSSVVIHFVVAVLIVLLSETVGLWLVNHYLVIPQERIVATNYVFHLSVFVTFLNIMNIPNNASIISNEKMSFYAVVSILDGFFKLVIAYIISIVNKDKLIAYAILIAIVTLINFFINKTYVNLKFKICRFKFHNDKEMYKELVSFSGWSLLSSVGSTCSNQVLTMILNHFFGVVVNAAMGIANQVNNTVYRFVSNFQVAFEPQITKSYASKENDYLLSLIFKTSKFSFYLLWFFVLPLSLNVSTVLTVWLSEVPEYSVIFLRLILIYSLIDSICGPLWMVSYAIGNIRNYQIVAFVIPVLSVPVAWMLFKFGLPPYWIVIIRVLNNFIFSLWRLGYLKKRMNFPVLIFIKNVILPGLFVVTISSIVSFMSFYFTRFNNIVQFFVSCTATVVVNIVAMYYIGCTNDEKQYVRNIISNYIKKGK
ncbi:MAG: hypothetical protein SPE59_00625 [Treponema sp.]|nr:hypothetical protein [Treponema sp.]